ncbi:carbohydrate-binding protein [Streptosporangium carneum]|nr:carbohydrate-binding protein [Streptosporangium carneum]
MVDANRAAPAVALITTVVLGAGLYGASAALASPASGPRAMHTATPTNIPRTWTTAQDYKVGDLVLYDLVVYRCLQAHSALEGWEPPGVPALWQPLV